MPDQIEKFLSGYDANVARVAMEVRKFITKNVKGVTEQLDVPAKMIMYSLGPGYKGMVCTIIPSKKGIKLGFYRGIELPDPSRLLTGTGKVHRHVQVLSEAELAGPELKKLLSAAECSCRERLAG